jgi:hypothetical protein
MADAADHFRDPAPRHPDSAACTEKQLSSEENGITDRHRIRPNHASASKYMQSHELVKIDANASTGRDQGRTITPPVMGIGTPVVAG